MLITIVLVLLILGLALFACERFLPIDATLVRLIEFVLVIIAIIYIASAAGLGRGL
jgi:hypothetical protein